MQPWGNNYEDVVCTLSFPCSAAGGRMVSSMRAVLLKGLGSTDPVYATVDDAAEELKERIQQIHTLQKESACGKGISPARVELIYCTLIRFSFSSAKVCAPRDNLSLGFQG